MTGRICLHDYWRSSASYRVRIALNLAGLAYESLPVDLDRAEQRGAAHLARNPQGLVPVLEIDGLVLTQSLAIIGYLEETGRLVLGPADPALRARSRAVAMAIAAEMAPICNRRVLDRVAALAGPEAARDWVAATLGPELAALEAKLADRPGPYAFGETVTLADLCLVPQIYNARRWEIDLRAMPRLVAIDTACRALPAFAAAAPERVLDARA